MTLDIEYQLQVNSSYLHTGKTNEDLEVFVKENGHRYIVSIKAKKDIILTRGKIERVHTFSKNDIFPTNGFQSWTDTSEKTLKEKCKEKNVKKLPKFLLNAFAFDKYGDATFYPYKKNTLHGYNIFYVKGEKEIFSYNYNYEKAYVIYEINTKTKTLDILSDVYGHVLKKGEELVIYDLYYCSSYQKGYESFCKDFTSRSKDKIFGYTSWYNYYQNINENIILRDLESLDQRFNLFQIDDGYETFVGDWLDIDKNKFPHGLKPIVDKIHERGYKAGIWLAPFVAETNSNVFKNHQDWLKRNEDGSLAKCGSNWSGFYALDLQKEEVKEYIKRCLLYYVELGFDFFKLDFLYASMIAPTFGKSRAMMSRETYQMVREVLKDKMILGCGANCFSSYGLFDYLRIGPDVSLKFDDAWFMHFMHRERISTKITLQNTIYRSLFDKHLFLNDPDVFLLRKDNIHLKDYQKNSLITINSLFGSVLMTSDNIAEYDEQTKNLLNEKLNLFYNAKDVSFKKNGKYVNISYSLDGQKYEFVYNPKKGKITNE